MSCAIAWRADDQLAPSFLATLRAVSGWPGLKRLTVCKTCFWRRAVTAMWGVRAPYHESSAIMAAAFSPIMIVGACVQAFSAAGMIEASAMRSP